MRAAAVALLACLAVLAGCGGDDGGSGSDSSEPLVVGASLPLTGDDAQLGEAVKRGYEIWEQQVNAAGGILGRPVKMKLLDDGSNQNTVISDYNALLSRHDADFVFGTFSTRLTIPALSVVERQRKLYLDPAGAAPDVFDRGNTQYFYTAPAPSWKFGSAFAEHLAGLPEAERPKTAAYVITKDPFTRSTVDGMKEILEAGGIETAFEATYPLGERNFDPIAARVKQSGADVVINAGGFEEEVGFARALKKADAVPQMLYQSSSPVYAEDYAEAVGADATEGVFFPAGYSVKLDTAGNREFAAAFEEAYDVPPGRLSAAGFSAGQVLQAAVEAVGEDGIEQQAKLAEWLHANPVETVMGELSWDDKGVPQSTFAIGQWQDGEPQVVLPPALATSDRILLCYRDC